MVSEEDVSVSQLNKDYLIKVVFVPTVPHCSLASLIGKFESYEQRVNWIAKT